MSAAQREKIQQLGFWDSDVSAPKHDEITMWAFERAEDLAKRYVKFRGEAWFEKHSCAVGEQWPIDWVKRLHNEFPGLEEPPAKRSKLVVRREIEAVLREREPEYHPRQIPRNQRILGYADVLLHCVGERLSASKLVSSSEPPGWDVYDSDFRIVVEVKSVLPTLGELMRQLNLYRQSCRHIVLIAPDDRYADVLAEQEVLFVKYQP
ncbi:hypothetical protein [Duganella sp. HH105]|uniref:hypothetical protein n=1 Tax=Duganella sp. HH105 TaxID=1781067 RepID=UPI000893326F|nr:hypothetical protein [Duganella sp. HH105]OEZ54226.1 hypothetical protein DUGA6_58610 [Duganella sp. HH105]